jgi:hypothetical protein
MTDPLFQLSLIPFTEFTDIPSPSQDVMAFIPASLDIYIAMPTALPGQTTPSSLATPQPIPINTDPEPSISPSLPGKSLYTIAQSNELLTMVVSASNGRCPLLAPHPQRPRSSAATASGKRMQSTRAAPLKVHRRPSLARVVPFRI